MLFLAGWILDCEKWSRDSRALEFGELVHLQVRGQPRPQREGGRSTNQEGETGVKFLAPKGFRALACEEGTPGRKPGCRTLLHLLQTSEDVQIDTWRSQDLFADVP